MNVILRCLAVSTALALALPMFLIADDAKSEFKMTEDENAVVVFTNKMREKEGLPPLKPNPQLFEAARAHSKNMAKQKKMDHVLDDKKPVDRVRAAHYVYSRTGENIAMGTEMTPESAVDAWMNSPPHKKNILTKEFAEIGIGVARIGKGEVYYTQVFGTQRADKNSIPGGGDKEADKKSFKEAVEQILELTNKARENEKLQPLKLNDLLTKAAQDHSENQARQHKMEHVLDGKKPNERVEAVGYEYSTMGENVAFSSRLDAQATFKGWMNSKPHRANILTANFAEIGIGVARSDKGEVYYTQVFGSTKRLK